MKWNNHSKIFTVVAIALGGSFFSAHAQTENSMNQKFKNLDQMILQLEESSKKNTTQSTTQRKVFIPKSERTLSKPVETPIVSVIRKQPVFEEVRVEPKLVDLDEIAKLDKAKEATLAIKLSELPPMTRFEFNDDLFIPANKQGALFTNGSLSETIENNANTLVSDIFLEDKSENTLCALTSDHSHIMFRGNNNDQGKATSYLDVKSVSFYTANSGVDREEYFVQVDFHTKNVKTDTTVGINIKAFCRIPKSLSNNLKDYTIGDVNNGFGEMFSFKIPKYIEI